MASWWVVGGFEIAAIQELAVKGVVNAVKAPIESLTSSANLLHLPAISQLQGHPQYSAIYRLLEVGGRGGDKGLACCCLLLSLSS